MEITGQTRTELVEAVRVARAVVDTGWPRDLEMAPEILQMENFLRAGLVNMVAGKLLMYVGAEEFQAAEMGAFAEWRSEIRGIVQLLTEKQRLLVERVDVQVELNAKLLNTLGTAVTRVSELSSEVKVLAQRVSDLAFAGGS